MNRDTIQGYIRPDGSVGIRNHVAIIPTVACANGVADTKQNLQAAQAGEEHEFQEMYPAFIQEAEAEGNRAAVISFRNAMTVEKIHFDLYGKALAALTAAQDPPETSIHVCAICGNTVEGAVPDKCPVCGAPKAKFREVA